MFAERLAYYLEGGCPPAGPGRYETLEVGTLDGYPMLTVTSPHGRDAVPRTAPAPAYVAMLAAGLAARRGWDPGRTGAHVRARAVAPVEAREPGH